MSLAPFFSIGRPIGILGVTVTRMQEFPKLRVGDLKSADEKGSGPNVMWFFRIQPVAHKEVAAGWVAYEHQNQVRSLIGLPKLIPG